MKQIKAYVTAEVLDKEIEYMISQMSEREKETTLTHVLRKYGYHEHSSYKELAGKIKEFHSMEMYFDNRFYYVFLMNYTDKEI